MLKLGLIKLASCSGCINELITALVSDPDAAKAYEVVHFVELGIVNEEGPFDILFVEGSIVTEEQERYVRRFRDKAKFVVALGTCAVLGGLQALRVDEDFEIVKKNVYPHPEYVDVLNTVKPLDNVVPVDYMITGCPANSQAIALLLKKYALGGLPIALWESVCGDCKRKGVTCLLVAKGIPCLGPITMGGCGALCPSFGRGCYGCYGLKSYDVDKNRVRKMVEILRPLGFDEVLISTLLKGFGFKSYRVVLK